jgi:hypothetical protein
MSYYTQGVFKPKNPAKYKGTQPICYRSRPELLLMNWFDIKNNIIEWTSESVIIPYVKPTDGQVHRYFIDFSCKFKNPDNTITKYIIEYKPFKQTQLPVKTAKKSERTFIVETMNYAINRSKWKAAEDYARHKGMKFIIVTEKELEGFTS